MVKLDGGCLQVLRKKVGGLLHVGEEEGILVLYIDEENPI